MARRTKNKPVKAVFYGPDENFTLEQADTLFIDELKIKNKKTKDFAKAYKKMDFLFELICFMHGEPNSFDKDVVKDFAGNYPEILTINDNEHTYNMNYLLVLFHKYGACWIEEDGHIVIDNTVFDDLRKYYMKKTANTAKTI